MKRLLPLALLAALLVPAPAPAAQVPCVRLALIDEHGRVSNRCGIVRPMTGSQIVELVRARLAVYGIG